jgi:hypothetical protein
MSVTLFSALRIGTRCHAISSLGQGRFQVWPGGQQNSWKWLNEKRQKTCDVKPLVPINAHQVAPTQRTPRVGLRGRNGTEGGLTGCGG